MSGYGQQIETLKSILLKNKVAAVLDYVPEAWFPTYAICQKKNKKNWYTIDALGAIFAIFTILDTFQYF